MERARSCRGAGSFVRELSPAPGARAASGGDVVGAGPGRGRGRGRRRKGGRACRVGRTRPPSARRRWEALRSLGRPCGLRQKRGRVRRENTPSEVAAGWQAADREKPSGRTASNAVFRGGPGGRRTSPQEGTGGAGPTRVPGRENPELSASPADGGRCGWAVPSDESEVNVGTCVQFCAAAKSCFVDRRRSNKAGEVSRKRGVRRAGRARAAVEHDRKSVGRP